MPVECTDYDRPHPLAAPSSVAVTIEDRWTVRELIDVLPRGKTVSKLFVNIYSPASLGEESESDFAELRALAGTLDIVHTKIAVFATEEEHGTMVAGPLMSSVVALAHALEANTVSFSAFVASYALGDDQLISLVDAAPSATVRVDAGIPSAILRRFANPSELCVRECSEHLRRLCASSVRKLEISADTVITAAIIAGLLEVCTNARSSLLSANFYLTAEASLELREMLRSKATKRALCDTPHYTRVAYYDLRTMTGCTILSEKEWKGAQEIKRGIRAFFSAAALANLPSAPYAHLFLNACGRDVKREIVGYLL